MPSIVGENDLFRQSGHMASEMRSNLRVVAQTETVSGPRKQALSWSYTPCADVAVLSHYGLVGVAGTVCNLASSRSLRERFCTRYRGTKQWRL
jgi:hypothetical protein